MVLQTDEQAEPSGLKSRNENIIKAKRIKHIPHTKN